MPKRKLAYRLKVTSIVISSIYVVVEFLWMVGLLFEWPKFITRENFAFQNTTFCFFGIITLNTSMICLYCRYVGYNYKSDEHQKNLKKIGCVAFYWTITLMLKTMAYYVKELQFDWTPPKEDDQDQSTFQAIGIFLFFFAVTFVTDVVPLVIVIDSQFIKIFSFEFIREYNKTQNARKTQNLFDSVTNSEKKNSFDNNRFIISGHPKDNVVESNMTESQYVQKMNIVHIDDPSLFKLKEPFETPWYNARTKHKLG